MQSDRYTIINFHGIGAPERAYESGEKPYWISVNQFEQLADYLSSKQIRTKTHITFDDGNESDLKIAQPILARHDLTAEIFVLSGKLDKPGYLSSDDLRKLQDNGLTIGTHGQDHVSWTSLPPENLDVEVVQAREKLQDIIQAKIGAVSIPFGKYNRRVLGKIRQAGFNKVYTSDGGHAQRSSWLQPRLSVRADTPFNEIAHLVETGHNWKKTANRNARIFLKHFI